MTRYILVDKESGYVWEEAEADNAVEACRLVDIKIEGSADHFEYEQTHGYDDAATYFVFTAPDGFREITDGTDPEQIEAVETQCRQCATVIRTGESYL